MQNKKIKEMYVNIGVAPTKKKKESDSDFLLQIKIIEEELENRGRKNNLYNFRIALSLYI